MVKREVRIFHGTEKEVQNDLNIFLACKWVQEKVSVSLQLATGPEDGLVTVLAVLTWPWKSPWEEKPNG